MTDILRYFGIFDGYFRQFIASLVEFECEPDPQFGDKPAKIVRTQSTLLFVGSRFDPKPRDTA